MTQHLRLHSSLAGEQGSVPSTRVGQLTPPVTLAPRALFSSAGFFGHLHSYMYNIYIKIYSPSHIYIISK